MTMLLGYENHVDQADVVLAGGVWTIPLTNLQSPLLSRKARSSGLLTSSTKFTIDLGASRAIRMVAITHTNLTSSGQYRITWYSDAFSTAVGNTGWLAIPGYPDDDPDGLGASIFHVFASATTARYWQVELDDTANPDNYVEVGRLIMPTTWEPPYNFDNDSNVDAMEPNTPRQDSLGGVGFFNRRTPARVFRFSFGVLPAAEMEHVRRIRRISNLNRQVVIIPKPDAIDHERCFVGTLRSMSEISLFGLYGKTGFEVIESVP